MNIRSKSDKETFKFGLKLGKKIKCGLVCLYGDLGAGKTTFVKGFAKGLLIKSRIQSPTFTYLRIYKGKINLYHFDCYRLKGLDELLLQEISEILENDDGIVVIEWAEKVDKFLPRHRIEIYFEYVDEMTRNIKLTKSA